MKEKINKFIKENYKAIICIVCLIGFLILAENIFEKEMELLDNSGYHLVSHYLILESFTPIAIFITNLGGTFFSIALTVILFIVIKNKKVPLTIFINLCCAIILNILLKNIVQRPRPIGFRLIEETGYSFPSGHSMVSMAFYGYLIYLIYKNVKNKYWKWLGIIGLSILIIAIGVSRIYLGVHYTSDVIAGFLVSIAYLIVFIKATYNMTGLNK